MKRFLRSSQEVNQHKDSPDKCHIRKKESKQNQSDRWEDKGPKVYNTNSIDELEEAGQEMVKHKVDQGAGRDENRKRTGAGRGQNADLISPTPSDGHHRS